MATFQEVQDRINNEYLNRGTFIEETKGAIRAAIRHYESKRWGFNETAVALATSAGAMSVAFPSNYISLDYLQITVDGKDSDLIRRDRAWILSRNGARAQSLPTDYATFRNSINLSPIPDAIYALPLHYIKRLPALDAATDDNEWLDTGWQDVIAYHAAKLVWGVAIRNDTEAAKFATMEQIALDTVSEELIEGTACKIKSSPGSF